MAAAKHVPSMAPGAGPQDASAALQYHRDLPDAAPTRTDTGTPPGGYPATVGGNPDAPAERRASDGNDATAAGFTTPGPYSQATAWHPQGADY